MKRLRRWIVNGVTLLSLLLGGAVLVIWVRSLYATDSITFDAIGRSFMITTPRHELQVEWSSRPFFEPRWWTGSPFNGPAYEDFVRPHRLVLTNVRGHPVSYRWLGFYVEAPYHQVVPADPALDCWFATVGIPCYSLFVLAWPLPVARLRQWLRHRRRRRSNSCRSCGYNLTGNASGRCPECGGTVPTALR